MRSTSVSRSTFAGAFCVAVVLSAACIIAPVQGCAALSPQGLTRPGALSLLRGHDMFKKPAPLPPSVAEKFPLPAEKADEPEPVERALELFFEDRPVMGVLHHLGLIEATAAAVERPQRLAYTGYLTTWKFRVTPNTTAARQDTVLLMGRPLRPWILKRVR